MPSRTLARSNCLKKVCGPSASPPPLCFPYVPFLQVEMPPSTPLVLRTGLSPALVTSQWLLCVFVSSPTCSKRPIKCLTAKQHFQFCSGNLAAVLRWGLQARSHRRGDVHGRRWCWDEGWGCRAWCCAFLLVGVSPVHHQPFLNTQHCCVSVHSAAELGAFISLILPSGLLALRSRRQKVRSQLQRQAFNYRGRFPEALLR